MNLSCVSHALLPRERVELLALVGNVYCIDVAFPCGILGQVCYLIVSFPDLAVCPTLV